MDTIQKMRTRTRLAYVVGKLGRSQNIPKTAICIQIWIQFDCFRSEIVYLLQKIVLLRQHQSVFSYCLHVYISNRIQGLITCIDHQRLTWGLTAVPHASYYKGEISGHSDSAFLIVTNK